MIPPGPFTTPREQVTDGESSCTLKVLIPVPGCRHEMKKNIVRKDRNDGHLPGIYSEGIQEILFNEKGLTKKGIYRILLFKRFKICKRLQ